MYELEISKYTTRTLVFLFSPRKPANRQQLYNLDNTTTPSQWYATATLSMSYNDFYILHRTLLVPTCFWPHASGVTIQGWSHDQPIHARYCSQTPTFSCSLAITPIGASRNSCLCICYLIVIGWKWWLFRSYRIKRSEDRYRSLWIPCTCSNHCPQRH